MNLSESKSFWDELGKKDPFWAILTDPSKKGNKWLPNDFFATGNEDIANLFALLKNKNVSFATSKALDFGCGAGRLTRALSFYFDQVYGVDISSSMIQLAKRYNKYPQKCFYDLNNSPYLFLYKDATFDFIYTKLVLQHIKPQYTLKYLKEFLRILKPKGILVFQLPSKSKEKLKPLVRNLYVTRKLLHILSSRQRFPMYCISKEKISSFLAKEKAKLIATVQNTDAGSSYESYTYIVQK